MDIKLNAIFFDTLEKNPYFMDEVKEMEDVIIVYYPLGWNETIEGAVNNPCWFLDDDDHYVITIAGTSSDRRAGDNLMHSLKRNSSESCIFIINFWNY